jgi:lipoprotein-anchoring transpeptidase ErfK/SrfK
MKSYAQCLAAAAGMLAFCAGAHAAQLSKQAVESAQPSQATNEAGRQSGAMLRAQVLLDRAHFSPGAIDGIAGENSFRAIRAFREFHRLGAEGRLDERVWRLLIRDTAAVLTSYTISKDDVHGPFQDHIPDDLAAMAKLDRLSYTSPVELLAEKFHMSQELLRQLNPDADFSRAGTELTVASVRKQAPQGELARIVVDKRREGVIAYGQDDRVIAYYPATIGSADLPSPTGETKVLGIAKNPKYHYSPELDFKGAPDRKLVIAPGPNNPVGVIWIDLEKEGYGLHGTPEPAQIGKESSHGCVRLTNWDALELGQLARAGLPVIFGDAVDKRRS